jgi:hypothetical protein
MPDCCRLPILIRRSVMAVLGFVVASQHRRGGDPLRNTVNAGALRSQRQQPRICSSLAGMTRRIGTGRDASRNSP